MEKLNDTNSLVQSVERALRLRCSQPDTNLFRVCDGEGDGLPGLFIDSFDGHWLVQTRNREFPQALGESPGLGWRSLWWKRLDQQDKQSPTFVAGERMDQFTIWENGAKYHIDFQSGYSQGIFLDQRLQRARLQSLVRPGQTVLNLFAYTCAFSVVAALRGAITESIDLSRPYLDWGKRNFELNGLDPAGHYFCRGDSFAWLRRLARKGKRYDFVILDPPTFSRNDQGGVWQAEKDYTALLEAALEVAAPKATLLCCTNHRGISPSQFQAQLLAAGRTFQLQHGQAPADFTGPPYLKATWLLLKD